MTTNATTSSSTATIGDAVRMLYELDVRHLPIVDAGELVGIISDRDLRSLRVDDLTDSELSAQSGKTMMQSVSTVMSSDVVTLERDTSLKEAIDVMVAERVGAIPVVRTGTRELLGIVSYVDLLKALRQIA